ncbi:DUF4430 domain-containing protein [Enorma massiliensis]|uniref:DUF4430 domain-containing protein n=1 Tax=Enorma massiliensis TaxID=1472761 RepID=UPI00195B3CD3|nr:DUF4430 domain-containing protein [Enorma massiliensis]MBM6784048.1 DUF4430 domain-containing protein [Enorma massiliensis]
MSNTIPERMRSGGAPAMRGIARRAAAAALAVLLVWGQVPAAAWAEVAPAESSSAANAQLQGAHAGSSGEGSGDSSDAANAEQTDDAAGAEQASDAQADEGQQDASETADNNIGAADTNTDAADGNTVSADDTAAGQTEGSNQPAGSAEKGSTAALDDENQQVVVSVSIYGMSASHDAEEWLAPYEVALDEGQTAEDALVQALEENNIVYDATPSEYGLYFQSITSPFDAGNTLSYDGSNYWQFMVDGASASTGASSVVATEGASYALVFGSAGELPSMVRATFEVYGIDVSGNPEVWTADSLSVEEGTTAAELTERMLDAAGIAYDAEESTYGWYLNSMTSSDGRVLAWDEATGAYWQLWVNGAASDAGASSVTVEDGMSIAWYYAAYGAEYPENGVVADPDAEQPDWEGAYGFGQGTTTAETPAGDTEESWVSKIKDVTDWQTNVSDPLVAHGRVYICAGSQLIMMDAATGEELGRATLVEKVDSIARMVMVDGLIIVPVHNGRLQALTADTLTTVWYTDALPAHEQGGDQQALGSLTVEGGYLYFATASASWSSSYNGYLLCVDIKTGDVVWQRESTKSGFYWAGAAVSGSWAVIADDAGTVTVFNRETGETASTLALDAGSRSQVVNGTDAGTFIVVTKDGCLHKIAVDSRTGIAVELGSVKFGSSSTSTPVVAGGKVYVGGASLESYANSWGSTSYYGTIAVIDEASLAIEYRIISTEDGYLPAAVQASPLVSQQGGSMYVYFTCNTTPGGVYRYRVGDKQAELIYTPAEGQQNYCMASVVCGSDGTLYYINDSGNLFAIKGASSSSGDGGDTPEKRPSESDKVPGNTGTVSENGDDGAAGRRPAGAVSPELQPLAASNGDAATSDDEALEGAAADGSDAEEQASASAQATSAFASDAAAERGLPSWVPVAGIVVGVCGLAAIGIYLAIVRKRS